MFLMVYVKHLHQSMLWVTMTRLALLLGVFHLRHLRRHHLFGTSLDPITRLRNLVQAVAQVVVHMQARLMAVYHCAQLRSLHRMSLPAVHKLACRVRLWSLRYLCMCVVYSELMHQRLLQKSTSFSSAL